CRGPQADHDPQRYPARPTPRATTPRLSDKTIAPFLNPPFQRRMGGCRKTGEARRCWERRPGMLQWRSPPSWGKAPGTDLGPPPSVRCFPLSLLPRRVGPLRRRQRVGMRGAHQLDHALGKGVLLRLVPPGEQPRVLNLAGGAAPRITVGVELRLRRQGHPYPAVRRQSRAFENLQRVCQFEIDKPEQRFFSLRLKAEQLHPLG